MIMRSGKLQLVLSGMLFIAMITGCSKPTYVKEITTNYDANGNVTGSQVRESISQKSGSSHSLVVDLDNRKRLEIE